VQAEEEVQALVEEEAPVPVEGLVQVQAEEEAPAQVEE